jgi:hypothetical protein
MKVEARSRARSGALRALAIFGLLTAGAGVGFLAHGMDIAPRLLLPRATRSIVVVKPSPNVVTAIHSLSRLESAEYHLERVMDVTDRQSHAFGLIEADDSLLLVVAGDVVAGVDLADIDDDDVQVDREKNSVQVTLPAPKILSARLDSERTYVHSRSTDLLARHNPRLESDARAKAEKELTAAAKEAGILNSAAGNASRSVTELVRALGFRDVSVTVRDSSSEAG